MSTLPECTHVDHMCAWCSQEPEESVSFFGTGITHGCESLSGYWELNLGPLQDQHVFLTTESSLHLHLQH